MKTSSKWIEGIAPETPVTEVADQVLRARLNAAMEFVATASRKTVKDPEYVHQLRVATRRATAALNAFKPWLDESILRKLRKRLRRIRRVAGEARDLDIFASALAQRKEELSDEHQKSLRFLLRQADKLRESTLNEVISLRAFRKKLRRGKRKLMKALHAPVPSPVVRLDGQVKANGIPTLPPDTRCATFRDAAQQSLPPLLAQVMAAAKRDLEDLDALHQLRLTTKRLRYAMEIFAGCFGPAFKKDLYPKIETLQQMLGDINDSRQITARLDCLAEQVKELRSAGDPKTDVLRSTLAELRRGQVKQGQERHSQFVAWWKEFNREDFSNDMARELGREQGQALASSSHRGVDQREVVLSPGTAMGDGPARTVQRSTILSEDARISAHSQTRRIAAIDVGTNSIRLTVAEVSSDGRYRILDDEKETTRLGRGLEATGEMAPDAMERSAQSIARMKKIADGYNVDVLRAIGTCALREAANRDDFLALVERQAGLVIEPIVAEAEAYLAHVSVANAFDLRSLSVAVVDIGGGSTEIVFSSQGVVEQIYTLPLGAVLLTEKFGGPENPAGPLYRKMRRETLGVLKREIRKLPFAPQMIIGTGGTYTSLANVSMQREGSAKPAGLLPAGVRGYERNRSEVRHLLEWLRKMPLPNRIRVPGLSRERADIIVAGLTIVERVMKYLGVNRLQVHDGGIRDGLLRTMAATLFPSEDRGHSESPDRLRSVRQFASACSYEEAHCLHVAGLAVQIFDQLAEHSQIMPEKWADPGNRILLEAAAILHDVGYFVNYSKHHQHSYHLIAHSDLAGFTPRETELVANIGRYHCRAEPKRKHPNYAKLAKADRRLVRRLSAILRIAEGLDRGHTQNVRSITTRIEDSSAVFLLDAADDPAVDIWGAEHKCRLFQKVFKLKPRFEWNRPLRAMTPPPASPVRVPG
jgi:exopolyphosphatase / guanosine-5'-triphosphate,3'-diphosphate pyrophosphatase